MIRSARGLAIVTLAVAALAPAGAQDPRLGYQLDAPSRTAITAILDSAAAQGIPREPLMEKVLEGTAKGVDGPRIVAAVRTLALEMASVHRALGTVASVDEIKAAASAMHAGVPAVELGKLKKQSGLRRSLTLPFTVLGDLISRGVPVEAGVNAIRSLVGAGAKDADINTFQRNVSVDIEKGAPPAAAAETRAKAVPAGKPESGKPDEQ
ncbi:MAG: hypothetical protein ACHQRK_10755 [Gemmatimonadales bacterium]|jgi:hypothetical protein